MSSMNINNGRVDIKTPKTGNLFAMYDRIPAKQCSTYRNPLEGQWEESLLSRVFFSKENIQILQNGIRAGVYNKSQGKYTIAEQDCDTLKIIMRSTFLQYAANQPSQIREQVAELNQLVLNYCVPQVYSEMRAYMIYLNDVSTMAVPIAHPVNTKNDDKELILEPWF